MQFDILTIFPRIFDSYFNESILARAQKKKLIKIKIHNLRDWAEGKHKIVDDRPYGGGPGMILKAEPIVRALRALKYKAQSSKYVTPPHLPLCKGRTGGVIANSKVIMLTPAGKKFTQRDAERLAKYKKIILLCGRYEGFDSRVEKFVDEKISIGDYILAGGELPAMILTEAISRQIPGVVGHKHALDEETFSKDLDYVEYPQYTRPESLKIPNSKFQILSLREISRRETNKSKIQSSKSKKGKIITLSVPKVLLSGNHKKIMEWREKHAKNR